MDISKVISTWKLNNAFGKRMLFLECPFWSHDINTRIFQYMGFDVKVHQFWCEELDTILNIESKYQLSDFDVILMCIEDTVSKEFLDEFRKVVQLAEVQKSSSIPIVGMNLNLKTQEQITQAKVFEGLFIGRDTTDEQIREMFRNLLAK